MYKLMSAQLRWRLILFSVGFAIFVVYGSLVPLQLNAMSIAQAIDTFSDMDKFDASIVNRADWFTNFLLMMPLYYTLLLLQCHKSMSLEKLAYMLVVFFAICGLSILIEFVQLFVDQRITSFKDVYAQAFGMILVALIYLPTRHKAHKLLVQSASHEPADKWEIYAIVGMLIFAIYSLMPFDLSMSISEIGRKWASGRINTIPFYELSQHPMQGSISLVTDIAIWFAIMACYVKSAKHNLRHKAVQLVLIASAIELAQLAVLSRYTDVTDIVAAIFGVLLAIKVFSDRISRSHSASTPTGSTRIVYLLLAAAAYYFVLLTVVTYPMHIVDRSQFSANLAGFFSLPFGAYWQGDPFTAITQLMRKIVVFIPIGVLFRYLVVTTPLKGARLLLAALFLLALTFSLEIVQLAIVDTVASVSDSLLNLLGLWLGIQIYNYHQAEPRTNSASNRTASARADWPYWLGGLFFLMSLFVWFIAVWDYTPYNVKEMFDEYPKPISVLLMVALTFAILLFPVFKVQQWIDHRKFTFNKVARSFLLLVLGTIVGLLIVLPNEALYDVVGSPVWPHLPRWLETSYRLLGLLSPLLYLYFMAAIAACIPPNLKAEVNVRFKLATAFILLLLPFSFIVVVMQAGTDNLIELLPNQGYSSAIIGFAVYAAVLFYSGLRVPRFIMGGQLVHKIIGVSIVASSGVLGYWSIELALIDVVFKYNSVFTPLQFLLSPARDNLYSTEQVFIVFLGLHYTALLGLMSIFKLQHVLAQLLCEEAIKGVKATAR